MGKTFTDVNIFLKVNSYECLSGICCGKIILGLLSLKVWQQDWRTPVLLPYLRLFAAELTDATGPNLVTDKMPPSSY